MEALKTIESAFEALMKGETPKQIDSVSDGLAILLTQLIEVYVEGKHPIANTVDGLFKALANKKDPMLVDLGLTDRMTLWASLNMIRKLKDANAK